MHVGYALICEEHPPSELVANAALAAQAGFASISISDHFHPWLDEQGHSPFAWTVLGALTERVSVPLLTQVTCPTKRYHPAIVAQMAATTAAMADGGFTLGLGTGEWLNEHVVGGEWPDPATRLDMLEEAVDIISSLLDGGEQTHRGGYFTVDRARLYTLPEHTPRIAMAAGGTDAAAIAARLGLALISNSPSTEVVDAYRDAGGGGPVLGQGTVCWAPDESRARELMHERWRHSALDWDANAEIVNPAGFTSATQTVREEDVVGSEPLGTDVDAYLDSLATYRDAGFDQITLHNVGPHQEAFIRWAGEELLPRWKGAS